MSRRLAFTVIGVLAAILVAGWVFAISGRVSLMRQSDTIATSAACSTLDVGRSQTAAAHADATLSAVRARLATATSQAADASSDVSRLSTEVAQLERQVATQSTRIAELEQISLCERRPSSIDYSSNSTVSESLRGWLEDIVGTIDRAEWDVIWTNSRASIHRLRGEHQSVYIVWFEEPDLGFESRVFDVGGGCYLDF